MTRFTTLKTWLVTQVTGDVPLEPTGSDSTDTLLLQDMVTVTRKLLSMSTRARTAATKSANKSKAAQHKAPTKKPAAHPVSDKYAEARSVCLKQINHDRHTLNLKPLVAWEAAWPCTDAQAAADGAANRAHSAFTKCQEWAQNECPGWPFVAEVTIVQCLAQMWAEGPGKNFEKHGHYINMSNKNYTRVSCGFAMVNGKLWATQDFTWA